jgi:alanine-glyoxylate transaminase / (R)-3-amino-2-methylpropionate-pyruvate transaminase
MKRFFLRRFSQLTTPLTNKSSAKPLPKMPSFDYMPLPYKGPTAEEILKRRTKFLSPSIFHFYKKPVFLEPCLILLCVHPISKIG